MTKQIYQKQVKEENEFRKTGKETKRMLALRGVPTDVELPRHLEELLNGNQEGFEVKMCYWLQLDHGLMGTFPAILKDTKIVILTHDKETIVRVWRSLKPRRSKMTTGPWMVSEQIGIAYNVPPQASDHKHSLPHKLFRRDEINTYFAVDPNPFDWAPGRIGAQISEQWFNELILKAA